MLEVWRGDITKLEVDVIVNAANSSLLGGGGVDGAIHRAAGKELEFECRMLAGCKTGQAKITKGYKLPAKYIIHTVGPVWRDGHASEQLLLEQCYLNSLKLAESKGLRSIAFPAISTGIYGFPAELAAVIAIASIRAFLEQHPGSFDRVILVAFDANTEAIYQSKLESNLEIG
jgi:O-acetyl-ADP-ribose deacetylase